jgi:hypothetical protein
MVGGGLSEIRLFAECMLAAEKVVVVAGCELGIMRSRFFALYVRFRGGKVGRHRVV